MTRPRHAEGDHALRSSRRSSPTSFVDALMPGADGSRPAKSSSKSGAGARADHLYDRPDRPGHIIKGLEAGASTTSPDHRPRRGAGRIRVHLANARMAHSARTPLDAFGRFLLAASRTGHVSGIHREPQVAEPRLRRLDREGYVLRRRCKDGPPLRQLAGRTADGVNEFERPHVAERDAPYLLRANRPRRVSVCA